MRLDLPEEKVKVFAETLSSDEMARAEKFTLPHKYCEYVLSRGLLRLTLALVSSTRAEDLRFAYTAHNKPCLEENTNPQGIAFNVSHSHDYVLIAMGVNRNIGVDVEKIRAGIDCEKLAQRFFSSAEYAALMQVASPQRVRAFYAIWTHKEALIKATGKGIAGGLSEFDLAIDEAAVPLRACPDADAVRQWRIENISVAENYAAALVSDGSEFALRCWTLPDDFLQVRSQ